MNKGSLPAGKFNEAIIDKFFAKEMDGENIGINFQTFYLLSYATDIIAVYGETVPGIISLEEF